LHGLRNSCALDDKILELAFFSKLGDLLEEIFSERAANAPVLEAHELLLRLDDVGIFDQLRVDVELRHVVNDDSAPQVALVFKNVLEQCGLAGSKET